ncbi:unnamed protein product [Closterium sp. NIES-54]
MLMAYFSAAAAPQVDGVELVSVRGSRAFRARFGCVRRTRDLRALWDDACGARRADPAASSPRCCSPRRMPLRPTAPRRLAPFRCPAAPPSLLAVSSPRGPVACGLVTLACTVASPAHAQHAAFAPARRVRQRLPDTLHPRPPGQPKASSPRPTHRAPACYPTCPPVGPAAAAEFAPTVGGDGGVLEVVAVSGGDGGGCSCGSRH